MGIPASFGIGSITPPPAGDQANTVLTGQLSAVGPGLPLSIVGPFNVVIWATVNTALTATSGSLSASVASGTGIAAGTTIMSTKVPLGTTWATFSGTSGTLALPTYSLFGYTSTSTNEYGFPIIYGLNRTVSLTGSTVSGPGIPSGTTVTSVVSAPTTNNLGQPNNDGVIQISATPTSASALTYPPTAFTFALSDAAVASGTDSAALFMGAGTTFSGTVQVERSFDGGHTYVVCNSGGGGALAQFTAGTPVSLSFGEPERGVLYRVNCISYSSGTINYRISTSGAANMALAINQLA